MSVQHKQENAEFTLTEGNQEATLKYQLIGNDRVEFLSTYVPFSLRGKGLAETLVLDGLKWAKNNNYKISSRCWYVDKFLG